MSLRGREGLSNDEASWGGLGFDGGLIVKVSLGWRCLNFQRIAGFESISEAERDTAFDLAQVENHLSTRDVVSVYFLGALKVLKIFLYDIEAGRNSKVDQRHGCNTWSLVGYRNTACDRVRCAESCFVVAQLNVQSWGKLGFCRAAFAPKIVNTDDLIVDVAFA